MKKQKNAPKQVNIALILLGIIMAALTPAVQNFTIYFLTKDCPQLGDIKECGLSQGLENANVIVLILILWIIIAISILITGLLGYISSKRKSIG